MSRLHSRLLRLLLSFITSSALAPSAFAFTPPWYYGPLNPQIGTDTACLSNPPITETRVAGYSGYTYYPPYQSSSIPLAQLPAVGEIFYAKLVLSHPGNPCAGSAVGIELLLPAGVTPAMSSANPAFCFARTPPGGTHPNNYLLIDLGGDVNYGCPQTFSQGIQALRFARRTAEPVVAPGVWRPASTWNSWCR
jgi:hypothetical protein